MGRDAVERGCGSGPVWGPHPCCVRWMMGSSLSGCRTWLQLPLEYPKQLAACRGGRLRFTLYHPDTTGTNISSLCSAYKALQSCSVNLSPIHVVLIS